MTPREAFLAGFRRLKDAGVPDPDYDAAQLLAHVTGGNALSLRLDMDHVLSDDMTARYLDLLTRREQRIPLQHLLGTAWFLGREFLVSDQVLIPRPETGLLVTRALSCLRAYPPPVAVLDLCTGSGCIAVSVALSAAIPVQVTASDLSRAALDMAEENARRLGATDIRFVQGDGFRPFAASDRFALILSNPPYIPSGVCPGLQPEVLHDPLLALDGGPDGLDIIRKVIAGAPDHLIPGGRLLMEIGWDQGPAVRSLLSETGVFTRIEIRQDDAGLDRFASAIFQPQQGGGVSLGAIL